MTLYLGKVVLMLRNAVEHGTDHVAKEGLLIESPGYWKQKREGKIILDWLKDKAKQVSWRPGSPLPLMQPKAANSFLLTPASLQRCVVMLTLVMHAGFSQLQLP